MQLAVPARGCRSKSTWSQCSPPAATPAPASALAAHQPPCCAMGAPRVCSLGCAASRSVRVRMARERANMVAQREKDKSAEKSSAALSPMHVPRAFQPAYLLAKCTDLREDVGNIFTRRLLYCWARRALRARVRRRAWFARCMFLHVRGAKHT